MWELNYKLECINKGNSYEENDYQFLRKRIGRLLRYAGWIGTPGCIESHLSVLYRI